MTTVAVLGGGVAGLSAAHELAERGFAVTVYEQRDAPGGKARSIPYAGSGTGGRADLPGEHGFRFFPGFYRHLPDTMGRIPSGAADGRATTSSARPGSCSRRPAGRTRSSRPAHLPESAEDFAVLARFLREAALQVGVPPHEYALLVERLLTLLTSCDERREQQWELQSWWEFTGAERRSAAFQRFLADGLTRTLVAARGREMSARTGGADPDPAAAGPHARRRPRRPRARRADERGLDRPVGGAPDARAASSCASASPSRRCTSRAGGSAAPPSAGAPCTPTTTSPRCPSRSCASSPRRRCGPPSRG